MNVQSKKNFIINFLYFVILLGITIFICREGIFAIMPFAVAFVVALLLKPAVRFLNQKLHIQKGIAGVVLVVLFYSLIGLLLVLIGIKLFATVKGFVVELPNIYNNTIEPLIVRAFTALQNFTEKLDPSSTLSYTVIVPKITAAAESFISTLSVKLLNGVTGTAMSVPGFLINTLICIIATVFIAIDWGVLRDFVIRQFSDKNQLLLHNIRVHLGKTLGCYVRSYALIMLITFAELSLGLFILGVENTLGLAALIALFDILPVVGSGTILIPWAVISAISGDYLLALGLGVLYVVIVIIRNIIEPKIVGERVGLHPIVTLIAMVVGVYVFGGIGLLGLPIAVALIQSLNEQGVIHLYNKVPKPAAPAASKDDAAKRSAVPESTQQKDAPAEEPVPVFGKEEIDIDPEDGKSGGAL